MLPSLAFVALWVRTYDYGYQGALHAVVLSGYLFAALNWTGRARWAVPAAATLAVALCVWPLRRTIPLWQPKAAYEGNDIVLATPAWREAMAWLRDATPPPSSPPSGRVGVLTDWGTGNLVNTLAGRPSTSSRFPEAEGLRPLLTEDEDTARAASLRGSTVAAAVRYVALEPRTIAEYFQPHTTTAGIPPQHYAGTGVFIDTDFKGHRLPTLGAGYDNALAVRLLRRDCAGMGPFRLVYESRAETFLRLVYDPATGALGGVSAAVRSTEERARFAALQGPKVAWREGERWACQGQLLASVKLFEQVEGARLTGRAEPDARVTLSLPLRLRISGRAFTYERTVRAGGDGAFELICPYATEAMAGNDVEPAGPAALVWPGGHGRAQISETAVQTGAAVPVVPEDSGE